MPKWPLACLLCCCHGFWVGCSGTFYYCDSSEFWLLLPLTWIPFHDHNFTWNSLIGLVARMLSYYPYLVKALKAYVPLHYVHWSRSSRGLSLCMKVFKKCRLDLKKPGRRVCRLQQKHIFTKGESRSQRKEMKLISQMFTATHFPLTRFVVAMVLVSTSLWAHGNYSLT